MLVVEKVSLEEFRHNLRFLRDKVRINRESYIITYRDVPVAVLAPFDEDEKLEGNAIAATTSEFRKHLTTHWMQLTTNQIDAIVINLYDRPFAVFKRFNALP